MKCFILLNILINSERIVTSSFLFKLIYFSLLTNFSFIKYLNSSEIRVFTMFHKILYLTICNLCALSNNLIYLISSLLILSFQEQSILLLGERLSLLLKLLLETIKKRIYLHACLVGSHDDPTKMTLVSNFQRRKNYFSLFNKGSIQLSLILLLLHIICGINFLLNVRFLITTKLSKVSLIYFQSENYQNR